MAWSVAQLSGYTEESIGYGGNTLVKGKSLRQYIDLLSEDPEEAIRKISVVRDSLFTLDNMRVLVVADVEKLPNPVSTWDDFVAAKPSVWNLRMVSDIFY